MSREHDANHLSPEAFVDVIDGAPVDASWRQHLASCERCRGELEELRETLSLLDANAETSAAAAASPPRRGPTRGWVAVAAAVLLIALGGYWLSVNRELPGPSADSEELLPPIDEDEEFQLLLALSNAVGDNLPEVGGLVDDELALDPSRLTPEEQELLVEQLTEEVRSSS